MDVVDDVVEEEVVDEVVEVTHEPFMIVEPLMHLGSPLMQPFVNPDGQENVFGEQQVALVPSQNALGFVHDPLVVEEVELVVEVFGTHVPGISASGFSL